MKFVTKYNKPVTVGYECTDKSICNVYQYTPTSVLVANSMLAGAMNNINRMNEVLYSEGEDLTSDEVSTLDIYPPDIAESFQKVRFYSKRVNDAHKRYRESLAKSEALVEKPVETVEKVGE